MAAIDPLEKFIKQKEIRLKNPDITGGEPYQLMGLGSPYNPKNKYAG